MTKVDKLVLIVAATLTGSMVSAQATGVCNTVTASSSGGYDCNNVPWVLVFEDDFDGEVLDESKWVPITGVPRDMSTAPMWYTPDNISVTNGVLRLRTEYDLQNRTYVSNWNPLQYNTRLFHYTSAEIDSYYKYGEGRFVGRVKVPGSNASAWPAFWTYGQFGAAQGEIDIFEYWHNYFIMRTNLHKGSSSCSVNVGNWINSATSWRVYTSDWERHHISWTRDDLGLVRWTPRWSTLLGQSIPCNNIPGGGKLLNLDFPAIQNDMVTVPMQIILNNAMRDNASGFLDLSNLPIEMEVDYVRYYRRLPCLGSPTYSSTGSFFNSNGEYNIITGSSITFNSGSGLQSGSQLDAMAVQQIICNPGFFVNPGSDFVGRIGPSNCGIPGAGFSDEKYIVQELDYDEIIQGYLAHEMVASSYSADNEILDVDFKLLTAEDGRLVLEAAQGGVIHVLDMSGRRIRVDQIGQAGYRYIDLTGLTSGVYLVCFVPDNGLGRAVQRVVVTE